MKLKFFLFSTLIFVVACKRESKQAIIAESITLPAHGIIMNADSIKPPQQIEAGKPTVFMIPVKPGNSYSYKHPNGDVAEIDLLPPVTHSFADNQAPGTCNFTNFTNDHGLASDNIICAKMDKMGNLWFGGGNEGVSKYDGKSFTTYTTTHGLTNNNIWSIGEDKMGNLWFGTYGGGVSKFDGHSFTNYTKAQGLAGNSVRSILEDKKGNLWFGTFGKGVSKFDGQTFTNYTTEQGLANNSVWSIAEDEGGNLWFGTSGGGVSKFDGKTFTNYTTEQGLAENNIWSITQDKAGNLWFGTEGGGVSKYDGQSFINYTTKEGLANNTVWSITEDTKGNLWFGTFGGGVSKYDGRLFTNYTTKQGLANNTIWSITEDKSGNLWFGTEGGGISKYEPSFTKYSTLQGLANNKIISMAKDKSGNLWFGTFAEGVSKYEGKSFTNYSQAQGLAGNAVRSICGDKEGNVWFGTLFGGVSKYDGKTFTNYTTLHGLAHNRVESIVEDRKGNIWFGTIGGGVSKFDGKSFTNYTTAQGLASNSVMIIREDKAGNLWFGTEDGGVSKYDGTSFTNYTTEQGLGDNKVLSITEDKRGNLWFGLIGGGLSCYTHLLSKDSNNLKGEANFVTYTTANGLPDNTVTQVLELPNGNIIVGTLLGIAVFNPNLPLDANEKLAELEIFNSRTGYPVKDINIGQSCMLLENKGIIWAATGNDKTGLVRFDYAAFKHNKLEPKVVILNVKINNENICWYNISKDSNVEKTDSSAIQLAQFYAFGTTVPKTVLDSEKTKFSGIQFDGIAKLNPLPINLVLPFEYNSISFDFNAIETGRPFLVNYQYLLEGYDKRWSPVTKKTSATFGNISEGSYTFKLKAQSPEGVWCAPITYSFKVLPPWYRCWWAYLLYTISTITFLLLVFKWRTASLLQRQKELEATIVVRTAELVQQKEKVEEKQKEILDSIEYAKRIQATILPSVRVVKKYLDDSFILYLPKDIVAGDFYWMESVQLDNVPMEQFDNEINQLIYFAACDCTGHGVPGAMVSVVCHNALNKALKEFGKRTPSEILDKVAELVIEDFNKNAEDNDEIKDGMDASLCALDTDTGRLQWAGANNPLWLIRHGRHADSDDYRNDSASSKIENEAMPTANFGKIAGRARNDERELIETKADKQPVGRSDERHPYTNHEFQLEKGDVIYLITDGYADQFGGPKGKKFKYKAFMELLEQMQLKPMVQQHTILNREFDSWRGALEQVDDVCVIGIRV